MHEKLQGVVEINPLSQFVDRLMGAVANEESLIAVLGENESAVLAVVDECVSLLLSHKIRIIRLRGSPGSPLTLPRIVQELGTIKKNGSSIDDDELIVRVLANPPERQNRILLIIEQAELLPLRTLAFLQIISTVFSATVPRLQILFSGHLTFKHLIEKSELAGTHGQLGTTVQIVTAPVSITSDMPPSSRLGVDKMHGDVPGVLTRNYYKRNCIIISLSTVLLFGVIFTLFQTNSIQLAEREEEMTHPPGVTLVDPTTAGTTAQPPLQSLGPGPSTPPSQSGDRDPDLPTTTQPGRRQGLPNSEQLALLRKEFEHFLTQTEWGSKRQSDAERSRLFSEFLQWNYGASGSGPELSPQVAATPLLSRARVTLHFLAGSTSGKGMALQFASTLRSSVALVRTRSVADVPKTFEVRYFAQEDEFLAGALAQMLQAPDASWTIRIMPDARPTPAPHTIELWIPLR